MNQNLVVWYVGAVALGLLFSWLIVVIYRKVVPADASGGYWSDVAKSIHGLLYGEVEGFWSHYLTVIAKTGKFVVRQLGGVALAFAPLAIALLLAGPWIFARWDSGAPTAVIPGEAGQLIAGTSGQAGDVLVLADGTRVPLPAQPGPRAVCEPDSLGCLALTGFGFNTVAVEGLRGADPGLVVVRSDHGDWNPLWPYLSDPEFIFFVTLSLGSILFFLRRPAPAEASGPEYSISLVDYVLTQVATSAPRFMNRLGDLETSWHRRKLGGTRITEPVFVAGLARSGTTILLEKLSSIEGVATHRYRDFPFIMAPLLWNRFLNLFGARQQPIERPHKDRIRITRDSPDAFEEPIWQFYFPGLHDPDKIHRLDPAAATPEFSRFYTEHIRKILWLRGGSRYLSKGNYNLPRIELIGGLFPDARFLIPIRHPLPHVESLRRQHRLFVEYSERDPKVPAYLRAVGHYEFGPQRLPISLPERDVAGILQAWAEGNDLLGYARQWAHVYGFVDSLLSTNPALAERIRIVRFEDLCSNPVGEFDRILRFAHLHGALEAGQLAAGIEAPSRAAGLTDEESEACWQAVAAVAERFGYTRNENELKPGSL